MMRFSLILIIAMLASSLAAAEPDSPEAGVLASVEAFKKSDLNLMLATMPEGELAQAKGMWAMVQMAPADPDQSAAFDALMAKWRAPDAIDALMKELEPEFAKINPQGLAGLIGFAAMTIPMAIQQNADKPEAAQLQQLMQVIPPLQQWVTQAGLDDREKARKVVEKVAAWAQERPFSNSAELRALSFEQAIGEANGAITLLKDAVTVYGLDVDAFLGTITASSTPGATPDESTLTIGMKMFDQALEFSSEMIRKDGKWQPKNAEKYLQEYMEKQMQGGQPAPGMDGGEEAAPF